jgi:hypothetical protein
MQVETGLKEQSFPSEWLDISLRKHTLVDLETEISRTDTGNYNMADAPLLGRANDTTRSTGSNLSNARNVDSNVGALCVHGSTKATDRVPGKQASLRI